MRTKAEIAALEAANGTGNDHVPESAHSFLTESQRAALDAALAAKQTAPGQLVDFSLCLAQLSTVDTAGGQLHPSAWQSPDSFRIIKEAASTDGFHAVYFGIADVIIHPYCYVGCSSSSHCYQVTVCNQGTLQDKQQRCQIPIQKPEVCWLWICRALRAHPSQVSLMN